MVTKMTAKKKRATGPRVTLTVAYDKANDLWLVIQGRGASAMERDSFPMKEDAIAEAARRGATLQRCGTLAELQIKNKNGKIGKGHGSRRSYGADPKRHKG